ncbi:MAG TPA: glucose-6-phosphate isomerase, partial [Eubacteriaceae bacterium]|nr:glucose-6-phosphate isomerase [Eubacteriaceae bacterium]
MSVRLNDQHGFIAEHEWEAMYSQVFVADKLLKEKRGVGNDFLGWMDYPTSYDKEEYKQIQNTAGFIRKNADALVVIGIGGSY